MKKPLFPLIFIAFIFLGLIFSLSSCYPYYSYGISTGNIIAQFEPDRGTGSTYSVGEKIRFRIRTNQDGFVTLTALNPDGRVEVFARNIFIRAGGTILLPTPTMEVSFSAGYPLGLHRVRASFTPSHTSGYVNYGEDIYTVDVWTQNIVTEIEPYPEHSRDIVETSLYIRDQGYRRY